MRKVICVRKDEDVDRWGNCSPSACLEIGRTYTLVKDEVHTWHTKYLLKEHPDMVFNSVLFDSDPGDTPQPEKENPMQTNYVDPVEDLQKKVAEMKASEEKLAQDKICDLAHETPHVLVDMLLERIESQEKRINGLFQDIDRLTDIVHTHQHGPSGEVLIPARQRGNLQAQGTTAKESRDVSRCAQFMRYQR